MDRVLHKKERGQRAAGQRDCPFCDFEVELSGNRDFSLNTHIANHCIQTSSGNPISPAKKNLHELRSLRDQIGTKASKPEVIAIIANLRKHGGNKSLAPKKSEDSIQESPDIIFEERINSDSARTKRKFSEVTPQSDIKKIKIEGTLKIIDNNSMKQNGSAKMNLKFAKTTQKRKVKTNSKNESLTSKKNANLIKNSPEIVLEKQTKRKVQSSNKRIKKTRIEEPPKNVDHNSMKQNGSDDTDLKCNQTPNLRINKKQAKINGYKSSKIKVSAEYRCLFCTRLAPKLFDMDVHLSRHFISGTSLSTKIEKNVDEFTKLKKELENLKESEVRPKISEMTKAGVIKVPRIDPLTRKEVMIWKKPDIEIGTSSSHVFTNSVTTNLRFFPTNLYIF